MKRQVFLGQVSAAGVLGTIAALFYSRVFGGAGWIGPIVGAVLLSGALAVALGRTATARPLRVIALAIAGILFVVLAVILPSTDFGGPSDIGSALRGSTIDGWRNSLSPTLPIDTRLAEPLGFTTFLAWLTGAITGSLLARSEQTALPIVPSVLFAGLSLPLAAPSGVAAYVLIAALIGAALLLALVRAVPEAAVESDSRDRVTEFVGERMLTERLLSGAPILILLGLLAPLLAFALPGGPDEPFDPRRLRVEEIERRSAVNPLAQIKARRSDTPPTNAFLLDLPAAPSPVLFDRMGLVALETFNGANWTTDSTYEATSADLAVETTSAVETFEVRQRVELTQEDLPWIPAAGQPIRIEGDNIWYDSVSGTLLGRDGQQSREYEVVSRLAVPTPEERQAASVDRSDPRYLELPPSIPPESNLGLLGDRLAGTSDFERLDALESALRDDFTLVLEEPSGTSIGRVEEFLIDREGYRDQFISAFAIAARQQGYPTRIVVGYRITEETEDNVRIHLETITSAHYDAWPEVLFEGIGWVPFDPVPSTSGEAGSPNEDATPISEGHTVTQGPTPSEADPEESELTDEDDPAIGTTVRVLVVSGLFLLLFPLMLLILVFIIKVVRRRWREGLEDPAARVLAGWQESKDRLLEAGVEVSPDMTVKEVVSASRRSLGVHASSSLSALAPHVTATIYAKQPPTIETADIVWDEVELFDRQLNETRSPLQTVKARVDPRPLLENA